MDFVAKYHTQDLKVRVSAAITTELVHSACAMQEAHPLATMALGRLLTGATLMASLQQKDHKVGIRISGDGPLGELFADARFTGEARGYCQNPRAQVPLREGKLDVASGVGSGTMTVSQIMPRQSPYQGVVPIVSGEIGQDIAFYLQQSHQIPSVIALSVTLHTDGTVQKAGGVLLEVLPGASTELVQSLETRARQASPLSKLLRNGATPEEMVEHYLPQASLVPIEHEGMPTFFCPCSLDRVERTLLLLGRASLAEMALKGEPVQVRCEFCAKHYSVPLARVRELVEELPPTASIH